jgi:hypothetical protein
MASTAQELHNGRLVVVRVVANDVPSRAALFAGSLDRFSSARCDPGEDLVLVVGSASASQDVVSVPLVVGEAIGWSVDPSSPSPEVGASLGAEAPDRLGWSELDPAMLTPHQSHDVPPGIAKKRE